MTVAMTVATQRRDDLGNFLRSRRARVTPADVGLPEGRRRRTPGLRREEVAQLAGVGVTWYTWLEQGRSINASVQVLDAIARTLRLDRAEREHLYRLAGVPSVPEPAGSYLPPELPAVLDALNPLPAVVYNGLYDVLAWNRSYGSIFPGVTNAPVAERNALWQMFVTPACCSVFADRDRELQALVATFRASFGRHLGEPVWTSFVERLTAASAEFAAMWARHDVATPASRVKVFVRDGRQRSVHTTSTSFAVLGAPDARLVVQTPVTEADRIELDRMLVDGPAGNLCPYHERAYHDHHTVVAHPETVTREPDRLRR